jgi:hypothetical protein
VVACVGRAGSIALRFRSSHAKALSNRSMQAHDVSLCDDLGRYVLISHMSTSS